MQCHHERQISRANFPRFTGGDEMAVNQIRSEITRSIRDGLSTGSGFARDAREVVEIRRLGKCLARRTAERGHSDATPCRESSCARSSVTRSAPPN